MTMPIPNLDSRNFDSLVEEIKTLIPQYTSQWTNHNVSDPGITLVELLAWFTEATLYRLNQTPDETIWNMIRLVVEEDEGFPDLNTLSLNMARVKAKDWYNERYRAVTSEDFEKLVLENVYSENTMTPVRVKAIPSNSTGIVMVVIVVKEHPFIEFHGDDVLEATFRNTRHEVKSLLDQRRLVGTRVRVRGPIFTEITIDIRLTIIPGVEYSYVKPIIEDEGKLRLKNYFDPLVGGEDSSGWPFSRPVTVHDIRPIIESIPNVGRVTHILINNDDSIKEISVADLPKLKTPITITVSDI